MWYIRIIEDKGDRIESINIHLDTMNNVLNLITILNQPKNPSLQIEIYYEREDCLA